MLQLLRDVGLDSLLAYLGDDALERVVNWQGTPRVVRW
jgi:hypothetical protein